MNEVTNKEIKRRDQFSQRFSRNYLANLFPYLSDQLLTFTKPELNLNFDLNIPKLNEDCVNQTENEFKSKHNDFNISKIKCEESDKDLKFLEFMNKKIKNDIKMFSISTNNQEFDELDDDDDVLIQKQQDNTTLPSDTSALFLSKLTDTPIANSDNDEQLIFVNKKPAANKEFLEKLNAIYMREILDLRESLEILRENVENFEKTAKQENKVCENLILNLKEGLLNEKIKKKKFYKNLIENLFSTANREAQTRVDDAASDLDDLDEEFYSSLKDNLIKLRETYDRTVEETRKSMDSLKVNYLADKQNHFNEAIERVRKEKERQIDELKQAQCKQNDVIAELRQQLANAADKDDSLQRSLIKQQKLVERNQQLEQQLNKLTTQLMQSNNKSVLSSTSPGNAIVTQQPLQSSISASEYLGASALPITIRNPSAISTNTRHDSINNIVQLNS